MALISSIAFLVVLLALGYLLLLAMAASGRPAEAPISQTPRHRFAITVPAHDEETVIGQTVQRLLALDYPKELFSVHVVADHCSDDTAKIALAAGAVVHERQEGPRSGKGAALSWLFQRILMDESWDAVVIFDADTRVDSKFLNVVDSRLIRGDVVIQGQHVISNPQSGWFPALTWAMFLIDNRFQNYGRSKLGWSAKHMGDSICFKAAVLREIGWGEGLTEDYQLRQRLLLMGLRIAYEPAAIGYGEAPQTWSQARAQRARWLRGTRDASRQFARQLLVEGIRRRDMAMLDGALQAYLPSYSTLTLLTISIFAAHVLVNLLADPVFPGRLVVAWGFVAGLLFLYPLLGLAQERAPSRAYLAILSGPVFLVWRTWLAVTARRRSRKLTWVRTAHGGQR